MPVTALAARLRSVRFGSRRPLAASAVAVGLAAAAAVVIPARAEEPATRPAAAPATQSAAEYRRQLVARRYRELYDRLGQEQESPGRPLPPVVRSVADQAILDAHDEAEAATRLREDVDARAKLNARVRDQTFDGADVADVIEALRDATEANIYVNWKALERAGVPRGVPVTFTVANNPTVAETLDHLLQRLGGDRVRLGWTIDEGVVSISTRADLAQGGTTTRVYDVREHVARLEVGTTRERAVERLVRRVQGIAPLTYADFGGDVGRIKELSGQLVITHTPEMHGRIAALLAIPMPASVVTLPPATRPTTLPSHK